jgi:uncharacterized membrane protein
MSAETRDLVLYLLTGCALACGESPNAPVQDDLQPAAGLIGSGYTLSDLGTPLPCADGKASGINEAGDIIVGYTCGVATMWQDNGGPITIDPPPGHTWSLAIAVNDSGQIVGASGSGSFMTNPEAMIYSPVDGMTSIHDPTLFAISYAEAINNAGEVAGWGRTVGGTYRVFRWTAAGGIQLLQVDGAVAFDINDAGTVVGYTMPYPGHHAIGVIWSGILASEIGTMGGSFSNASGINDDSQVVGRSELDDFSTIHAMRYSPWAFAKKWVDLGPPGSSSSVAYKISDQGRIVGGAGSPRDAITWYNGVRSYLPDLGASSVAYDVSRCGTIVGVAHTATGALKRPVRWDNDTPDCRARS